MTRRKLPIGIQTFREMREENYYYVDKTAYIQRLMDEGQALFFIASTSFWQKPVFRHVKGTVRRQ